MSLLPDTEDKAERAMTALEGFEELLGLVHPTEVIALGKITPLVTMLTEAVRDALPDAIRRRINVNDDD